MNSTWSNTIKNSPANLTRDSLRRSIEVLHKAYHHHTGPVLFFSNQEMAAARARNDARRSVIQTLRRILESRTR